MRGMSHSQNPDGSGLSDDAISLALSVKSADTGKVPILSIGTDPCRVALV